MGNGDLACPHSENTSGFSIQFSGHIKFNHGAGLFKLEGVGCDCGLLSIDRKGRPSFPIHSEKVPESSVLIRLFRKNQ